MVRSYQQFLKLNPATGEALRLLLHYRAFKKKYNFLQESQWWSKEKLEEYQLEQLNKLLNHAYENVPYYTKLFNKLGLKTKDIQDFKDLQKLPFLTKKIVKENINDFRAKNYHPNKIEYITTGGSTGEPLVIYVEKGASEAKYMAYIQSVMSRAKCHVRNKQIFILGTDKIFSQQAFGRILFLSTFFMSDENLPLYIEKIRKFKPESITGFPSAITNLAKFMNKNNIESFPSIKTIISSGETIYDWQRKLLEETFQCKVTGLYALNEQVVLSGTCEYSHFHHVFPEYGVTELIHTDGSLVIKGGEMGEIVGTGFTNYVFPLIRYKTGDYGIIKNQKCECGRNYQLLENVFGRIQQFIVTKSKRLVPLTGIYGLVAKCTQNVKECQLLQEKEGEINMSIIKDENYTKKDEELISKSFQTKFRNEINLSIDYTDNIPRNANGKHDFLIQKLPIEF